MATIPASQQIDKNIEYYYVGIDAPETMTAEEAVRLAKEAVQEAGFTVKDVELDDSWTQGGKLKICANMDIRGGVFTGRRRWSYSKGGVTVESEWP